VVYRYPSRRQITMAHRRFIIGSVGLAIVALAIGAFIFSQRTPVARSHMATSVEGLHRTGGRAPVVAGRVAIMRSRGSSVDAVIPLPSAAEAIELRVLPEFDARPARYRVRLFRMSADDSLQSVAELGGLAPGSDYFVTVLVDGAHLQPGQYRLAITGDPDTDARDKESAFILRMQRPLNDPSAKSH
jgi:hypothetical protein